MTLELVRALCACAGDRRRGQARRFLQGLSADELNYIAEFLGSCILESHQRLGETRMQLAEDVARFARCRRAAAPEPSGTRRAPASAQDDDHKMILLLEYLSRCASQSPAITRAANSGLT